MEELDRNRNKPSNERDDLQKIKGIGQSIAQALNKLGIYRYADLANFTPDTLADLLKTEMPSITSQRIEKYDWLGQAHGLAQPLSETESLPLKGEDRNQIDNPTSEALQMASEGNKANSDLSTEMHQERGSNMARENWRELADFFVSFGYSIGPEGEERLETKVYHSQAEEPKQWDGIVPDLLVNWMLAQANLSVSTENELPIELLPVETNSGEETVFELSDLWISEIKAPVFAGGRQASSNLLRAESNLNLSGPTAMGLTNEWLAYIVEYYLIDTRIEQPKPKLIASLSGRLTPGELTYELRKEFPIPPVGVHQLFLVARLLPDVGVTQLQGPIIRVES